MSDKSIDFENINKIIGESNVQDTVNKKIKLLIAQEELRKQRDKERSIKLEKVKNENFRKKLQKFRAELEHQEFLKKLKEKEMYLLKIEADKIEAEEKMLDEIKSSALEVLSEKQNSFLLDSINSPDEEGIKKEKEIEAEKLRLIEKIKEKRNRIKQKEDEITKIVNITSLKDN